MGSTEINFNHEKNQELISEIEKDLFQSGEIRNDGKSLFSTLIRRTLAQFLGQKYWIASLWIYIIRYGISIFALPFCILVPLIRGMLNVRFSPKEKGGAQVVSFLEVEFYRPFLDEIFPDGYTLTSTHNMELHLKDIKFILKVLRACPQYLLYPELLCRVVIRLGQYSYVIYHNYPKIISNFAEGSCWSSFLTAYCREFGIKHINIMHGVRYFSSPMAFAEFDVFYLWGEYHLEQFKTMKVSAKEFKISGNPLHRQLREIVSSTITEQPHRLLIMSEFSLFKEEKLFSLLCEVISQIDDGWEVACRLHYQEIKRSILFVKRLRDKMRREIILEDPGEVSLSDSLKKASIVVGCYTNALTDAWIAGRKCIYLHLPQGNKIPLQEYHHSKNIRIFSQGDKIQEFFNSPVFDDEIELALKNRFSRNI